MIKTDIINKHCALHKYMTQIHDEMTKEGGPVGQYGFVPKKPKQVRINEEMNK